MADSENVAASSNKKRAAGRQISKDNPEFDDGTSEPEMGTFQRASEEVLATRRIVRVRRQPPPSDAPANPFAGIRLVSSTDSTVKTNAPVESTEESNDESGEKNGDTKVEVLLDEQNASDVLAASASAAVDEAVETAADAEEKPKEACDENLEEEVGDDKSEAVENNAKEAAGPASSSFNSFQQLSSSQNAFTSVSGGGFGSFSFGSPKEGSFSGPTSGASFSSFSFGSSSNGASSLAHPLFGSSVSDAANGRKRTVSSLQEVSVETGEENEETAFTADATLYEYLDGSWKERGKGEVKVNTCILGDNSRLIMRTRGNFRLILNASLYPDMTLTAMDKKGITFACVNIAGEARTDDLTTCALKFKDTTFVEEFRRVVTEHKGKKPTILKTPDNSPKAADE